MVVARDEAEVEVERLTRRMTNQGLLPGQDALAINWFTVLNQVDLNVHQQCEEWFVTCPALPHGKLGPFQDPETAITFSVSYLVATVMDYRGAEEPDIGPFKKLLDRSVPAPLKAHIVKHHWRSDYAFIVGDDWYGSYSTMDEARVEAEARRFVIE